MPELNFIFCHGWGFDQRIIHPLAQALRPYFPEAQHCFYDLGFTGQTNLPEYKNNEASAQLSRASKRQGAWARTGFRAAWLHAVGAGLPCKANCGITATRQYDLRSVVPGDQHSGADQDGPLSLRRFPWHRRSSGPVRREASTAQRSILAAQQVVQRDHYIAIGHSYGFPFLAQQSWPWSAMIAINGFTHFCKLPGKKYGLPLPILDSTYTRLQTDAQKTIHEFHRRCGLTEQSVYADTYQFVNPELAKTLLVLRELTIKLPTCPILALATTHDKIVTPELSNECFALSPIDLHWFPGSHLSLLTAPDRCANTIAHFITQLYV